jgi:hypothetical protein
VNAKLKNNEEMMKIELALPGYLQPGKGQASMCFPCILTRKKG